MTPVPAASPILTTAAFAVVALTTLAARADVPVEVTFTAPDSEDQDDMAIWLHPSDATRSVVITSDKANGNIVVHGLDGAPLQTVALTHPGNIDLRHDVPWGDACIDAVVVNERDDEVLVVFRVEPDSGELVRIDAGDLAVGGNYGFALHRGDDGALSGFTGPEGDTAIARWSLTPTGDGGVAIGETQWSFAASQIEGMVADDDNGRIFLGEEAVGIWSVAIDDASDAVLIAEVGDGSGLTADVEGLTIYHRARGGYLIASSQGADEYTVLDRVAPHDPRGAFRLAGVGNTDGIDVLNVPLGDAFPSGLFTAHNGADCCPVVGTSWSAVAAEAGLEIDLGGWSPRRGCDGAVGEDSGGGEASGSEGGGDTRGEGSEQGETRGGDDGDSGADGQPPQATDSTGAHGDSTAGGTGSGGANDEGNSGCGCSSRSSSPALAWLSMTLAFLYRGPRRTRLHS